MISQTAEYALRAVVYMAEYGDLPHTVHLIAQATQVPTGYLSKVLQGLSRAGIVVSQRGVGGGFMLARKPEELTLFEVIQSVDPLQRIHTCPLMLASHGVNLCPLHRHLDEAMAKVEQSFKATTLADLLAEPNSSKPLCGIPRSATETVSRKEYECNPQPLEVRHD